MGRIFSPLAGNDCNDVVGVTYAAVSLNRAVNIGLQAAPGTVAGAEFENEANKTVCEVEAVTSTNQVIDSGIDAKLVR